MKDTYKGESPAKKIVRFHFWRRLMEELGDERFCRSKHLVLASREGGDISILLGLGVPPANILAAELNDRAHAVVCRKFPTVKVFHGNVVELAKAHRRKFKTSFLDFCSPLTQRVLDSSIEVLKCMSHDSFLGICLLASRESGDLRTKVQSEKSKIRDTILAITKGDRSRWDEVMKKVPVTPTMDEMVDEAAQESYDKPGRFLHRSITASARLSVLTETLVARGRRFKVAPFGIFTRQYQSRLAGNQGVPMVVYLGKVVRPGLMNQKKFDRKFYQAIKHWDEQNPPNWDAMSLIEIDEDALRRFTLSWADEFPNAPIPEMLNIPRQRLAAWKAHRTMGTYSA
jgi:hypothetical protein